MYICFCFLCTLYGHREINESWILDYTSQYCLIMTRCELAAAVTIRMTTQHQASGGFSSRKIDNFIWTQSQETHWSVGLTFWSIYKSHTCQDSGFRGASLWILHLISPCVVSPGRRRNLRTFDSVSGFLWIYVLFICFYSNYGLAKPFDRYIYVQNWPQTAAWTIITNTNYCW